MAAADLKLENAKVRKKKTERATPRQMRNKQQMVSFAIY
jgi:hypothetical protein